MKELTTENIEKSLEALIGLKPDSFLMEYKAAWRGANVVKIDTFYPSSQTCHVCGFQNPITKNLSVREWTCPECGTHHDRDINAAKNILAKALGMLKS